MGALLCGLVGRVTEKLMLVPGLPPGSQGQGERWEANPDEAEGLCKSAVGRVICSSAVGNFRFLN